MSDTLIMSVDVTCGALTMTLGPLRVGVIKPAPLKKAGGSI